MSTKPQKQREEESEEIDNQEDDGPSLAQEVAEEMAFRKLMGEKMDDDYPQILEDL